jgi:transglutaminase-like putative cysteine protease
VNYRILHHTIYHYAEPVTVSHHAARLKPRLTEAQNPIDFTLEITPPPAVRTIRSDYFGNEVCFFGIQQIHQRLEIKATSHVSSNALTPPVPALSPRWEDVVAMFREAATPETVGACQFSFDSPMLRSSRELGEYARQDFPSGMPLLIGVRDLTRRIYTDFAYDPVATTVATPLEEVWRKRRGVCQDFAHLAICSLRSLGLLARYVSGYIRTHAPPGKARLVGSDASHAWFSVYCPSVGWVDFDPTNNLLVADEHIAVAFGRDFSDVSPVSGILVGGGHHVIKVSVDVEKIDIDNGS